MTLHWDWDESEDLHRAVDEVALYVISGDAAGGFTVGCFPGPGEMCVWEEGLDSVDDAKQSAEACAASMRRMASRLEEGGSKAAVAKGEAGDRGSVSGEMEHRMTFTMDRLIDQIIEGRKTATAERIEEQGHLDEWDTGLGIGHIYTVHDSKRVARCRIQVVRMELCNWDAIPEWLWRGETNANAEEFREDHLDDFDHPAPGFEFVGIEFRLVEVLHAAADEREGSISDSSASP